VANSFAEAQDAALGARGGRKDKRSDQGEQPKTSRSRDKKRRLDREVAATERPLRPRAEYRMGDGEFKENLEKKCIFHPDASHLTKECIKLKSFAKQFIGAQRTGEPSNRSEEGKGGSPSTNREINYIFGGTDTYEGKRKAKLALREVMMTNPSISDYLKWSDVPITFNLSDHPDYIPRCGRYPLIVTPHIEDAKLNRVLID